MLFHWDSEWHISGYRYLSLYAFARCQAFTREEGGKTKQSSRDHPTGMRFLLLPFPDHLRLWKQLQRQHTTSDFPHCSLKTILPHWYFQQSIMACTAHWGLWRGAAGVWREVEVTIETNATLALLAQNCSLEAWGENRSQCRHNLSATQSLTKQYWYTKGSIIELNYLRNENCCSHMQSLNLKPCIKPLICNSGNRPYSMQECLHVPGGKPDILVLLFCCVPEALLFLNKQQDIM